MKILLLTFLFCTHAFAIELIIGGKTYYIEKYLVTDNGKKLVIPYTIKLNQKQLSNAHCETNKEVKREVASVIVEDTTPHPMKNLIHDLRGQFNQLRKEFRPRPKAKSEYKQNFK